MLLQTVFFLYIVSCVNSNEFTTVPQNNDTTSSEIPMPDLLPTSVSSTEAQKLSANSTTNIPEISTTELSCESIDNCGDCQKQNCFWVKCFEEHACHQVIYEFCESFECPATTIAPTIPPETTTATSEEPTSVTPESTEIPTTVPESSTIPIISTTTASPEPHGRHFDGASFMGGLIFATLLGGLCYGGWMYYKKKILDHRYANF